MKRETIVEVAVCVVFFAVIITLITFSAIQLFDLIRDGFTAFALLTLFNVICGSLIVGGLAQAIWTIKREEVEE